ncbi:13599_t:CDS:2 [Funneliformis geosporum]|nr:13599_t:CDS:2 [Funneliformis geosporum]
MTKHRKSSNSITHKPESSTKEYRVNEKILALILARITALENENKALKDEAKKKVLVSRSKIATSKMLKSNYNKEKEKDVKTLAKNSQNYESNTINKDHNNSSVTLPILKPSEKSSRFANLHLKLNLKKNIYESYRTAFYGLIKCHTPVGIQYKNLNKNIRAGIICKFKKANPHFPECIGDWALMYFMRHKININRPVNGEKCERTNQSTVKDEKCENPNQSTVKSEKRERTNQSTVKSEKHRRTNQSIVNNDKRERKYAQKKMASTYLYSRNREDSYGNVNELDKAIKDHTHNFISNPILIYNYISTQTHRITSKRVK